MEQPTMMSGGMQGPGKNMNNMQRPQPGNQMQQIHATVMDRLRKKMGLLPSGWQTTFDISQRTNRIMQLITALRILQGDVAKCLNIAESFEERTIHESPSKEVYMERMQKKMFEIQQKRQQAAQQAPMGMPMNNANMGMDLNNMGGMNQMQNGGMGNMNMGMNMGNMGNMGMNMPNGGMGMPNQQMGGNGGQQNQSFPTHLQRPMQPSPLPFQQQQQQQQNNTLDPSALQNPQMPPHMSNAGQGTMQPPQQQAQDNQAQQGMVPTNAEILALARRMMGNLNEDQKGKMRASFLNTLNEQQRMQVSNQGDPLITALGRKARDMLMRQRAGQMNQGQNMGMHMNNNAGAGSSNVQQTPVSQPGAPSFDIESFMGQQANAIKSQESGGEVVPASNNNANNMNGQANTQQGVNPQMLGNQNASSNNPQLQYLAMQQERQKRERQQKQNQIAQQQAMAQQQAHNQLRGQPGGLNAPNALNGGQVNSPAMNMNMLNRPMAPPGQTTPSTPQPPRQAPPQTPVNGASQLAQHHQQMLNQNNQQQMHITTASRQQLMASLPPEAQQKINNLAPEQANQVLDKFAIQRQQQAQQGFGMANGQQSGMPQNMNGMGGPQMTNQQPMMSGMNMGNAVPGFNSQPPPHQQAQQQQPSQGGQSMQLQQRMQQHQQMQLRQRAMDVQPFPKSVLTTLGLSVPDTVNEWGRLKQHIATNQAVLPPNSLDRLNAIQKQWYDTHPEELNKAIQSLHQRMQNMQQQQQSGQHQQQQQQQQQGQSNRPPSSMAMQNGQGQAPPAPMVPPPAQMQQPGNQNAGPNGNQQQPRMPQVQPPSAQDIQLFRQKIPNAAHLTDDQIRNAIMHRKMQQLQQTLRTQQVQRAQAMANGGQQQNGMPQGNQAQQQPQQPQSQPQPQPQRPPQPQQTQNQQSGNQAQGQKRPQPPNDDVMEIPNPNARPNGAPQAPSMQQTQSQQAQQQAPPQMQQQQRLPTHEDLNKMPPAQRQQVIQRMQQMESLRRAQLGLPNNQNAATGQQSQQPQQSQPPMGAQSQQQNSQAQARPGITFTPLTTEQKERLQRWYSEAAQNNPKGAAVNLDPNSLEIAKAGLRRLWAPMQNVDRLFAIAIQVPNFGEERIKRAIQAKLIISQNAADANGTIKEYLAVTPQKLKEIELYMQQFFADLKAIKERYSGTATETQGKQSAAPAQPQQPQPRPQPSKQEKPPPVERKASQQSHARKASTTNKAPPAPTENKSFDWGSPSPHGVPKYEANRQELTSDKLKLPPQKRRKTGQQEDSKGATPATTTASPSMPGPKTGGPEQAKKAQQPVQQKPSEPERPKFRCDDDLCDYSINGFETEEQLKQHKETAHKPIEDPMKFMLENAAAAFGVDQNGNPLKKDKEVKPSAQPRGKPQPAVRPGGKTQPQSTPMVKQESATPATPASSNKAAAKPGATPVSKKTADSKPVIEVPDREKTLMETMAGKVGFEMPTQASRDSVIPEVSVEPAEDTAFMDMLQNTLGGADGFVDDWSEFVGIDTWGLRPEAAATESSPELTPSDQTSQSSRESDISSTERLIMNLRWDPFGNGDTGVPVSLMDTLGLSENGNVGQGDTVMNDGTNNGTGNNGQQVSAVHENWNSDMIDWDAWFGPQPGTENPTASGALFDVSAAF